jgi:hypothetical protein
MGETDKNRTTPPVGSPTLFAQRSRRIDTYGWVPGKKLRNSAGVAFALLTGLDV